MAYRVRMAGRNRLVDSMSPYLLQHADNPVHWWEWSPEAFAEARARNVPIFLSIGYSACHWCHVMAHESFENPEIAQFLNDNFVSIKVDREERPDIDSIYMEATVALTGHGGWPMTVFIDPDGKPFYAGTYFPPTPRHGSPSFPQLLQSISQAWQERPTEILAAGSRIIDALNSRRVELGDSSVAELSPEELHALLRDAVRSLEVSFDSQYGGFGGAPKFPPSMVLEFLLRMSIDPEVGPTALHMATTTLESMARGGMYDQIGGGFARYSVDNRWVVPHFEKMLYDNALLIRVYAHWWRLTGSEFAARIVRESVEFLLSELQTDQGAFASALDADSEGEEGKFYAWSKADLQRIFEPDQAEAVSAMLSVTDSGTFEHGTSTLQLLADPDDWESWTSIRTALFQERARRVRPGRDDKVVAAWNGLAIAALAEAGALFDEPSWIESARRAARTVLAVHAGAGGRQDAISRTSLGGQQGNNLGVLDDYANMAEGLLTLYQVTGEREWLDECHRLTKSALDHFADPTGGFFDTADDADQLVRRPKEFSDNAEPSGWFALANLLVRLSAQQGPLSEQFRDQAERSLSVVTSYAQRAPRAVGWGLVALWSIAQGPWELAVSGGKAADFARVGLRSPLAVEIRWSADVPPGAQVCRHRVCELPTSDPAVLTDYLASFRTQVP